MSLIINFMPAIKYPDLSINPANFLISFLFLLVFVFYSLIGGKLYRNLMIIGFIGSVFIFVVHHYRNFIYEIWILDVLSSIQYPLYVLYVAPLFGMNLLLDYNPEVYSFCVSFVFLLCFLVSMYMNKNKWIKTKSNPIKENKANEETGQKKEYKIKAPVYKFKQ